MCYEELQEIQELVTKELTTKTEMQTQNSATQETMQYYKQLQKLLEPFKQPLN